jgi:hypothetical protein
MPNTKKHFATAWLKFLLIACIMLIQVSGPVLYADAAELVLNAAALSDSEVKLDWNTLPDAVYYKIYRSPDSALIKTININTDLNYSSYTDSFNLGPDTEYTYTVEALDSSGATLAASSRR